MRVKGFNGHVTSTTTGPIADIPYFEGKRRQFSIQAQIRFKQVLTYEPAEGGERGDWSWDPSIIAHVCATIMHPLTRSLFLGRNSLLMMSYSASSFKTVWYSRTALGLP